jgi:hypothetical protein
MEASMQTDAKASIRKANSARNAAVRELIEKHNEEYTEILGNHREAAGLPRRSGATSQKEKALKRLAALEDLGLDTSALREQIENTTW